MNMKQKLLMGLVAATLTAPVFADSATDEQAVAGVVPKVALFDVRNSTIAATARDATDQADDITLNLTSVAPTVAGLNFTASGASHTGSYDISSNVGATATNSHKVTVSANTMPKGWKLAIDATDFTSTGGAGSVSTIDGKSVAFINGDIAAKDLLIDITNVATGNGAPAITWTLSPESTSIVPAHTTGTTITLTYTLSQDT